MFDSFQDHHSGLYGMSSEINSFKTPVNHHQVDSFQDPMFICSTKTVQIDSSFKNPALDYIVLSFSMGDTLQIDSVKSPWETTFRKLVLSRPFYTVNFRLISRPPCESYITFSEWTPFKTIQKRKWTQSTLQYSFSDLLDSFKDPTSEIKKTQDTGQLDRSFIITHCRGT